VPESRLVARNDAATFIAELKQLDNLHAAKQISDEEYVKMRTALVNRYSGEGPDPTASSDSDPSATPSP